MDAKEVKRNCELMLKAEGVNFEIEEAEGGKIINIKIRIAEAYETYSKLPTISAGEYAEELSVYVDEYGNKAVVPKGWTVSGVRDENTVWGKGKAVVIYKIPESEVTYIEWNDKFVHEELMETYDQFVWTPVVKLPADATLDGTHYNQQFGRINWGSLDIHFSESEEDGYKEELEGKLLLQKESINRYGGYYSTRYDISEDMKTGKPRSIKGEFPWIIVDYDKVEEIASTMIQEEEISTHLMYGAEYDSRERWIVQTGACTAGQLTGDEKQLWNHRDNAKFPNRLVRTGYDGCINQIYGFAENVQEWTQEKRKGIKVRRGGSFQDENCIGAHTRRWYFTRYDRSGGFRATMYIK